ncbi:hypothetical protein [Desulfosporosinus sp. BG]|uniref:hypothetical protein n=1 Tax=Desulfosporosinus sp. BG TaxID=1633135 RepID=UPI00159EFB01|nr:hypothetical protein [Desulfosporosinus sp. BG]
MNVLIMEAVLVKDFYQIDYPRKPSYPDLISWQELFGSHQDVGRLHRHEQLE